MFMYSVHKLNLCFILKFERFVFLQLFSIKYTLIHFGSFNVNIAVAMLIFFLDIYCKISITSGKDA